MSVPTDIGDYLSYDPETGVMHWKVRMTGSVPAGRQAGRCKKPSGYIDVKFREQYLCAHRVAWFLMVGTEPDGQIDHINGDPSDNRWANLRLATPSQNSANTRARRAGRLKGVTTLPSGKFRASLKHLGRNHYLGTFATERAAHEAYMAKAKELFGEFARAA